MERSRYRLALASASPRRQAFLTDLGFEFSAAATDVDESPLPGEKPIPLARRLAESKAQAAARLFGVDARPLLIVAADTVVALDDELFGKPVDTADASAMLARLRNRAHQVHSAVCVMALPEGKMSTLVNSTTVWMRDYSDAEIRDYVATGDPLDKAGAYAIQHAGFHPVARLDVCYTNVVGLPLYGVLRLLKDAGYSPVLEVDVPALCRLHFGYSCPNPDEGVPL